MGGAFQRVNLAPLLNVVKPKDTSVIRGNACETGSQSVLCVHADP
jgi:hypothetical protein